MAAISTLSLLHTNSIPKISPQKSESTQKRDLVNGNSNSILLKLGTTRLRAGLSQVEPDLNEDPKDRWATNGIDEEDFVHGKYDGHHTYYESDERGRV